MAPSMTHDGLDSFLLNGLLLKGLLLKGGGS
jgi:hypothetical protein